jgi:hypothetical protein
MNVLAAAAPGPFLSTHAVHLLTIALPAVALAVTAGIADLRARTRTRTRCSFTPARWLTSSAAVVGLVATAVHVRVAPEHFHEAVLFGVFFTLTSICQFGWSALMITRPRRWLVWSGAIGNSLVIGLWAYTRLVSVPIGPEAGRPEDIGMPDIIATTAETLLVILTIAIIITSRRRTPAHIPHHRDTATLHTGDSTAACLAPQRRPAGDGLRTSR